MLRCVQLILTLAALFPIVVFQTRAQPIDSTQRRSPRVDSVRVDTTGNEGFLLDSRLSDSTLGQRTPLDSNAVRRSRIPLREGAPLGSLQDREGPEATIIGKRQIVWMEYITLFDVLSRFVPAYPLSQGGPGTLQTFSYVGTDPSTVGYLYNGRPLRGTNGHAFDIETWPVEFLERIEVLRGARATIYGPDDGFMAINLVQPRFDVEGSYVRAWYRQGINNTTGGDVTYARNVGDAMNLALGFRRVRGDGVFQQSNGDVSSWDGRGVVTWYPKRGLTFSLTEVFTDATRGQNYGLTDSSSRSQFNAIVFNTDLAERTLRHDITISGRYYPTFRPAVESDVSFDDQIDSSVVLDGALYFTSSERSLYSRSTDSSISVEAADVVGVRGGFRWNGESIALEGTGHVEIDDNAAVDIDAGGLVSYAASISGIPGRDPLEFMVRGGGRVYEAYDGARVGVVGEVIVRNRPWDLRATARMTNVLTEPVYDVGRDALRYFSDDRTPFLGEVEWTYRKGETHVSAGASYRQASPRGRVDPYEIIGLSLRADVPLGNGLHFNNLSVVTIPPSNDYRFPLLYDVAEMYGRWKLLKGNLDLQIGSSFQFQTKFDGAVYDPVTGEFSDPDRIRKTRRILFPVWDAYLEARLGSAYVRLAFRNILDNEFYTLYRYPVMGRGFYLGANWAFVD